MRHINIYQLITHTSVIYYLTFNIYLQEQFAFTVAVNVINQSRHI